MGMIFMALAGLDFVVWHDHAQAPLRHGLAQGAAGGLASRAVARVRKRNLFHSIWVFDGACC